MSDSPAAASAPAAPIADPSASFQDRAGEILRSTNAQTLLAHVQQRLELALVGAGFAVQAWRVRKTDDDDPTLVVLWTSLQMSDPLTATIFEAHLRMSLKLARNGCMLLMHTEARQLLFKEAVVEREGLLFLSWDETDLPTVCDRFRNALATLAVEPDAVFADSDFEILAQKLTLALAP